MSNIIDSIQVSGVTYDLVGSGGGGVPESAFTAYTASTNSRIAEDEEVTAAALNNINDRIDTISGDVLSSGDVQTMITESVSGKVDTSAYTAYTAATNTVLANKADLSAATMTSTTETTVDGGGDNYEMLYFNYDDGVYYLSAMGNDENFEAYVITLKDAPDGNTVNIDNTTSAGETDSYILSSYGRSITITTKGNYRITTALLLVENEGVSYEYKTRTVVSKAVSTYIEEVINPTLSGKVDSSTYTAYTASTDTALAGKQTTLTAGTGIDITNNVISATGGGGGNPTVELTQAQYDALVTAGTVSADTYYIITDAQAGDLTNYYTKTETDNLVTAATATKQDTLVSGTNIKTINNESLLGSGNIDIQGGSTYTAGRGISIANDTISFSLPISAGTGTNSLIIGESTNISNSSRAIAIGYKTKAQQSNTFAQGYKTDAGQENSHAEGYETKAYGVNSHSEGRGTSAMTTGSHAEGLNTITSNSYEHTQGQYNVSNKANTTFGDSGNTLFSVGNGTSTSARHNAFEIRQNGDIYLTKDGQDVKLQDQLGGSSITVDTALDSGSTNPVENRVIYNKIDEVEQVTAAALNNINDKFDGLKLKKLTQAEYNALATKDASTLYIIVN